MTNNTYSGALTLALGVAVLGVAIVLTPGQARCSARPSPSPASAWTSKARWHHDWKKTSGTISITESGVRFQPEAGPALEWRFEEIQTLNLFPRELKLTGYENRRWHLHGERSFVFELQSSVPQDVAAELASRVAKPSENGVPDSNAPALATIPARHRTRSGGTNGVLRLRADGIDYVTADGRGARSWRWADIETIARPDPYHFRVSAYREIFSFELKAPMSEGLFDRLWNHVYARGLTGLTLKGGAQE